jgi:spermidine/putrescine-binding protein
MRSTRRTHGAQALTLSLVVLLVIGMLGSMTSVGTVAARAAQGDCTELNLLTWEGYADDSWLVPFQEQYGVTVNPTYIGSGDEELAKIKAGGGELYDAVSVSMDNFNAIIDAGGASPLDTTKLTNLDQLLPFLVDLSSKDGELYSVPWTWDVNPFIYDKDAFAELGLEEPTSWEVLWDPALEGKVAVWDDTSTLYIAANVLGFDKDPHDPFDLSDEELDQVLTKLVELKPNIRKIWATGGEAMDLFANGEAAAGLGWTYLYNELTKRGVNVGAVIFPNHGAHAWVDGWGIPTNSRPECQEMAYNWINWVTAPEQIVKMVDLTGYAPSNGDATELLGPELTAQLHLDDPKAFAETVIFKRDPARRDKYVEIMNEFKAS